MLFLLLCAVVTAVIILFKWKKASAALSASKHELSALNQKLETLSKYQTIVDAEKYAQDLKASSDQQARNVLQDAESARTRAQQESAALISAAETKAEEISKEARAGAKTLRERAEATLSDANTNAAHIICSAQQEAKKVAGDAYEALKKADSLQKTATAMKNIIEGYGDRYIIPTYSLLDHLADDYSHTQAGEELKRARERTRNMIKNETAANCDYVEDNRKQTAIDFVLDAFNGKVDTILASVRDDNFGTLEQKIKDAFQTVNHNGSAFRNARINETYLTSRLDELKYACTVQAIKEKEREEQRRIREQIREEEKAAKEYERAMKEAQKEEESLAKAMEKVKKDLEAANDQQRVQYEQKLKDLQQKLTEAEEKNKRALSMAQQTKTGHIYIISNIGSFGENVLKIGMTRRLDPMDRIYELGDASVPFDFDVHAMILSDDAPALEKDLHRKFSDTQVNKVNPRKEFFGISVAQLRTELERMGVQTHWTMVAEAREYRETVALNNPEKKAA